MKRNGFTLIELLAVIVILAIIALIATPIILGIINDAREKANERSVELYASAVRNAVAAYQLTHPTAPTKFSDLTVQYDGDVECTVEELYADGSFYLEGCKVNGSEKEYSYGEDLTLPACSIERQDENKYSIGDIVTCNIGETPDKFYVIADVELTATTIKMLTEKNIHTTEYRQSDTAGGVFFSSTAYWSSETTYPVDVYDERNDIIKPVVDNYVSYLNIKLTSATGSLLTHSQEENLGCIMNNWACAPGVDGGGNAPEWVYSTNYWIASAYNETGTYVISSRGNLSSMPALEEQWGGSSSPYGVRPVITISTSDIQ